MKLLKKLLGMESPALIVTTTRNEIGKYDHDVEANRSDPLIRALGEDYITNVKRTHERSMGESGVSYAQTKIGSSKIETETRP